MPDPIERPIDLRFDATTPAEDRPNPDNPQPVVEGSARQVEIETPIAGVAQPAVTPDGTYVVQVRIVVGPSAMILELGADVAQQFDEQLHASLQSTINLVRRANIGAPQLLLPAGANVPQVPGRPR